jgi:plastocyanin
MRREKPLSGRYPVVVLAALDSSPITLAIVVGVPLTVAVAATLAITRRSTALSALGLAAAIAAIGVAGWAVFHGPTENSAAAAPPGAIALPSGGPTASAPIPSPPGPPPTSCRPNGTQLSETASHISFQERCLAAPVGQPFTITFTNSDPGTMHDIHILSADPLKDTAARSFFTGQIVTGPVTVTYQVDALGAGTFFFHCDIHPTLMFGTFVVR